MTMGFRRWLTLSVCWMIRDIFNMPSREPAASGVLDKRLGVSNKKDTCEVRFNDRLVAHNKRH